MWKSQTVAEKTAKKFRGLLFLPHPVSNGRGFDFRSGHYQVHDYYLDGWLPVGK